MDSRRPPYAGPPPPNNHDPRAPPPVPHFQQHQQQQQQQHHPHAHPPPPPPQQHYPPPQHPPPPAQSQAQQQQQQQQPPPQQQHQQQYQHPPSYPPPPHSGANTISDKGPALPPIQSAAYAPSASSAEQQQPPLPSFRQPSAPPSHEQREPGPQYHPDPYHNRSGHATPAPVNRSYSHDSGQQRTPATPTGPPPFAHQPGPEGAQQPPPGPPPHPQPMEHGHPQYPPPTNGVQHHGLPHHPPHHEPHPQYAMTPMMDQHHSYPPPGQPMYQPQQTYGPASANIYGQKRKQMRATQACEQCRQRKQKCDEGSPCSFCKENSLSCQYRDTPPAKTDKNMEKLLEYMRSHAENLATLSTKIDGFEERLHRVEQGAQQSRQSNHMNQSNHTLGGAENEFSGAENERMIEDVAQPNPKPDWDDHRTAPHKLLLLWPSVRPLLRTAGVEHNDGYVMEAEDRGVLRLWTRGEGIDENDGTQPGGPASPARSDESGEAGNAPTPQADGIWGSGFPSTPGSDRRSEPLGAGGLKANGEVDLDANTVNMLYDSYMRNLHIMHPFLDKKRLRKMFDNFIRRYSTGRPRAAFAVGNDYSDRPLKRQRSNGSTANITGTGSEGEVRREQTERSPGNAIIYLVLALGKICMHKGPLPPPVPDSKLQSNSYVAHEIRGMTAHSPAPVNIKPPPMSPKSTPTTQPTPPSEANLRMHDARSRRSSVDGSPSATPGPRNLDVVPGIAYYAKAAEILGDQGDGNGLVHAQMFLLAGLYKGQLARVKESMSWITMAGRACCILLDRYKLYNEKYWGTFGGLRATYMSSQARIKDTRQSLIVLASWTCLQLESDILAELRLPDSGIQKVESSLLMPYKINDNETYVGLETDGQPEDYNNILIFYSAQMFLRKRLNKVHRQLYGKDSLDQPLSAVQYMLNDHEHVLHAWRRGLPAFLAWDDDDEPPSDILSARLRAKYWGARYVINRPFLDYALHIMPHVRDGQTVESVARDGYGNPRDKADIHLFKAIEQLGEREVWQAAKRCIDAAMHSTVAFDNVPDRLIVTNIHGTAHAQFGNMLVLSAVYNSEYMKTLVPEHEFKRLLQRTIGFLRRLSPISPTCSADCVILEKFQHTLFGVGEDLKGVYVNEGVEAMSASNSFSAPNS